MGRPLENCRYLNCCFLAHSADEAEDQKECGSGLSKTPVPVSAGPGVHLLCLLNSNAVQVYDAGHWG